MRYVVLTSGRAILSLFAGLLLIPGMSNAAPEPSYVMDPDIWQLDLTIHAHPKLMNIRLPGEMKSRNYWYFPYKVSNPSNQDVQFFPQFEILTDNLTQTYSERDVGPEVFSILRERYQTLFPLLESQKQVRSRILQGVDHARDSVAIFADFDSSARSVKLFVSGLSNEVVFVPHPIEIDELTGKPKEVLLRKTLMLEYEVVGDEINLQDRVLLFRKRSWIMR